MSAEGTLGFRHYFAPGRGEHAATTLLLLHGTGGSEQDLVPLGETLLPGAAILSPRGKVLEHGMPRFFRRLAMGVFDIPDLIARARELSQFVVDASATYGFDPTRIIAVGFSNGANIGAAVLLLHPGTVRGAVLFRAMVPLTPDRMPSLVGTSVFLGAGRFDEMVPAANTEQLAEMLRAAGAEVTLHWEAQGHSLAAAEVDVAGRWLASQVASATRGA